MNCRIMNEEYKALLECSCEIDKSVSQLHEK